jgi:hypothetical protein
MGRKLENLNFHFVGRHSFTDAHALSFQYQSTSTFLLFSLFYWHADLLKPHHQFTLEFHLNLYSIYISTKIRKFQPNPTNQLRPRLSYKVNSDPVWVVKLTINVKLLIEETTLMCHIHYIKYDDILEWEMRRLRILIKVIKSDISRNTRVCNPKCVYSEKKVLSRARFDRWNDSTTTFQDIFFNVDDDTHRHPLC